MELLDATLWAVGMALIGAIVFGLLGLVSGTDETATIAPITLLVILLGVPPAGVFAFFMAAIASAGGPIQTSPAAITAAAKRGFSARKP